MRKSDFWYDLPESLIAQTPMEPRDHSRLMHLSTPSGQIDHLHFYDLFGSSASWRLLDCQ